MMDVNDIGRYEERLINALDEAIGSGRALRMDPFAVDTAAFPDEASAANERRCIEATIRKHFDRAVELGLLEGTCAIAWHPETGAPQVFAIQTQPEQNYQPDEEALALLGALLTDAWDPGESPLTGDLFLDLVSGDGADQCVSYLKPFPPYRPRHRSGNLDDSPLGFDGAKLINGLPVGFDSG
jgi:hypothetical protein